MQKEKLIWVKNRVKSITNYPITVTFSIAIVSDEWSRHSVILPTCTNVLQITNWTVATVCMPHTILCYFVNTESVGTYACMLTLYKTS